MRVAFMFPGQGAQYIGMAKDFYEQFDRSKEAFQIASQVTGLDMESLVFEENDNINITEYTQIAILTAEVAILNVIKDMGIKPDVNLGLSLGEYGALVASDVISYEDACSIVRQRGILMEKEVPAGQGAMSAVLGLSAQAIEDVLSGYEKVGIANYNCPGQIVISGEAQAVKDAGEALTAAGAKRVIPLVVSGPFHSKMLKGAGDKLAKVLESVTIESVKTPYVANYNAQLVTEAGNIKEMLEKQVYSSVRFSQSIELLLAEGVDTFVEIGPGKTLTGFVKKLSRDVKLINVEKVEDLEKLKELV